LYFNKYGIFTKKEYIYNKEFSIYKYINEVELGFEKVLIILKFIKQIKEGTSNSGFIKQITKEETVLFKELINDPVTETGIQETIKITKLLISLINKTIGQSQ
jgi:hypothetical protein